MKCDHCEYQSFQTSTVSTCPACGQPVSRQTTWGGHTWDTVKYTPWPKTAEQPKTTAQIVLELEVECARHSERMKEIRRELRGLLRNK